MSSHSSEYLRPNGKGRIPDGLKAVRDVFRRKPKLGTKRRTRSNQVLADVKPDLEAKGFATSQKVELECTRLNGKKKGFNIDAVLRKGKRIEVFVEIEAGRTIPNNAYLLDLIKALSYGVKYLVLAVPHQYKADEPYNEVLVFVKYLLQETLLNKVGIKGVLVIGYGPKKEKKPKRSASS